MVYAPHIRITALGRLGTSGEKFSYGLNMAADGVLPTVSANTATWDDIGADVFAFHASVGARIASNAVLQEVKIARIQADGSYAEDPYIVNLTDAPGNASGSPREAPQTALAVSLNTDRRGPTGKGRFYLPLPGVNIGESDFLVATVDSDAIAAAAALLCNNLNNQPGIDAFPGFRVVVASSKGYNTPVTAVRVGRLLDTIRSRRRQLLENYSAPVAVTN